MSKLRRLAETLHAVALGTWFGCLVATAAAAAIIFPAIKELDPTLASYASYEGPHWLIIAGTPANTIFLFADAVQFACCIGALGSLIVVLVTLGSGWRRWDIGLRTVLVSVALTLLAYRLLIQSREMAEHLNAYWSAAAAGDNATAATERAAFDALHHPASNLLVATALAVLGALIIGVWSAQKPPTPETRSELETPGLARR